MSADSVPQMVNKFEKMITEQKEAAETTAIPFSVYSGLDQVKQDALQRHSQPSMPSRGGSNPALKRFTMPASSFPARSRSTTPVRSETGLGTITPPRRLSNPRILGVPATPLTGTLGETTNVMAQSDSVETITTMGAQPSGGPLGQMQAAKFAKRWMQKSIAKVQSPRSRSPTPREPPRYSPRRMEGSPEEFIKRAVEMNPMLMQCRVDARLLDSKESFLVKRVEFLEHLLEQVIYQDSGSQEDVCSEPRSEVFQEAGQLFSHAFKPLGNDEYQSVYTPREPLVARTERPPEWLSWIAGV